jgi:PAS domain S-box-containing protein
MVLSDVDDRGFRSLLDRAPISVLVHRGGRVIYANEAFASLLGCQRVDDIVGSSVTDLGESHAMTSADGLVQWTGWTGVSVIELVRRDGTRLVTEGDSKAIELAGQPATAVFLRDISEKAHAVSKLLRAEENFRTIMERSPHAMCICRTDKMVYVNPAMLEYLGYDSQSPLIGPTLAELSDEVIHPDDRVRTRDAFRRLFADLTAGPEWRSSPAVLINDIRVRRKCDGAIRICDMYGVIVMHDGSPALVTYLQDLTERRAADDHMRLADRMSSLGTLAAGVAHEINNPLAYVMANVEIVGRRLASSEHARESTLARPIADAQVGLQRIRKIVQGMKTFSRRDEETIGPVDVVQVIESCIEMAQSQLRHSGRLSREYTDVPRVRGNDARLGQVFLNLLVNAAQALDEKNRERNVVTVKVKEVGAKVRVDVCDNGTGIPGENLSRIFDPFFSTKPIGTGTGLGLSVCHGIVSALGGEIFVESTLGQGTTVRIELPIAEGSALIRGDRPVERGRHGRVLVVDDELLLLEAVRRVLEDEHDVVTASSGEDALARLADGQPFDLIICDLMMPGMSGHELFARIKEISAGLASRVVFLTGGAVTPGANKVLEEAPNGFIQKPFDLEELRSFVQKQLSRVST